MSTTAITEMKNPEEKPSIVASIAKCKCPRCRLGDMFTDKNPYYLRTTMKMHEKCEICRQPFNLEVGFYYGSGYTSYELSITLSVFSFIVYYLTIGISVHDYRFLYWVIINAVLLIALQPVIMRIARCFWLSFFVSYDSNWRTNEAEAPERTNESQKNNW